MDNNEGKMDVASEPTVSDMEVVRSLLIMGASTHDALKQGRDEKWIASALKKGLIAVEFVPDHIYTLTQLGRDYMIASLMLRIEQLEDELNLTTR